MIPDSYTDEVLYSFRAIGMIDYDTSDSQTTPWQWVHDVPMWMHLSFHDHPILFFSIEHLFIKFLGVNLFAVRLPVVLAGLGSLVVFFLLVEKMFNTKISLIISFLFAINSYLIWISRIGIQDGVVLFFILLSLLFWQKSLENKNFYLVCGASVGFALLTKYTALILFPIFLLHAALFLRKFYKEKKMWLGIFIIFLITSPIWLYNIFLFRWRGHFDFQISAALSQYVPEWTYRLGRIEVGGLHDKFKNFFVVMISAQSILFNALSAISFFVLVWLCITKKEKNHLFILGAIVLVYLWFLVIGSTYRFVVTIIPFFLLSTAVFFQYLFSKYQHKQTFIYLFLVFFGVAEILFVTNSFYVHTSVGKANITYAKISRETKNFGFNELGDYLDGILKEKYTYASGEPDYTFLTELKDRHIQRMQDAGRKPLRMVIVYQGGLNFLAALWTLDRHLYYEGWPVMDDVVFYQNTGNDFDVFYRKFGIDNFIYIEAANNDVLSANFDKNRPNPVQEYIHRLGMVPKLITNSYNTPAFYVYEF
jgi:hypothetical protein